jgi:A/G-specific adenine glycosylase
MGGVVRLTPKRIAAFRKLIYEYYGTHARILPWRTTTDPYYVLVSEIMLQQTQVRRVVTKYTQFIGAFPDFHRLDAASLRDVLSVWQGLGYNRRALALKNIARTVVSEFAGQLPQDVETLMRFPGIGRATASAICAFAFGTPTVFVETNIRTVFIHCFFRNRDNVKDAEILPLVETTLDKANPREWYYALMDYGVMLKKEHGNLDTRSAHYKKQAPFEGSDRQIRGAVLRALTAKPSISEAQIVRELGTDPQRVRKNLDNLQREGFVKKKGKRLEIA